MKVMHYTAECCREAEGTTELFTYGYTFPLIPFRGSIISFGEIKEKLLTSGKLSSKSRKKKIKDILCFAKSNSLYFSDNKSRKLTDLLKPFDLFQL